MNKKNFWQSVRENVIGREISITTPFGVRLITYADYTASGRGVYFIENYLVEILKLYGNTHTEDDATGMLTTQRVKEAEGMIKRFVNADDRYKLVQEGYGSTGAIHRLQKILGVYVPPRLRVNLEEAVSEYFTEEQYERFTGYISEMRPVVFVGPYEHHSNELTWREGFCKVEEIDLDGNGIINLKDLDAHLSMPEYAKRIKIGSFSACSNVTGITSPVYEIARILHDHGGYAFFDFSASAPYVDINIRKDENAYFDAVFFSPHKFLGGPGSSGILLFHEKLYRRDIPPTCSGGGTVDYVGFNSQLYLDDIELREKPGTPGILQFMKAALAMELKEMLGVEEIKNRERLYTKEALNRMSSIANIEILGNPDASKRIGIVSFNIRDNSGYLHPKYIVKLLNDLFGIQTRAGCSCAGPYGHRLLHISREQSEKYKKLVEEGFSGLKPGWARVSFHYMMTEQEVGFILDCISFVAEYARYFLPLYYFDVHTGSWKYRGFTEQPDSFGLQSVESFPKEQPVQNRGTLYEKYLHEAHTKVQFLQKTFDEKNLKETESEITFIYYSNETNT
jgi:selenocysteine lyase/cysteine desulfurase